MDIATVTIKIHAQAVHPAHPEPTVPMENTAQMARKAPPDQLDLAKDSNVIPPQPDVNNAHPDPKDPTDPPDLLDLLAKLAAPVAKDPMVTQADLAQLVPQALPAQPVVMVTPDPKETQERMPIPAPKDQAVVPVKKEAPVQPAPKETMVLLVIQVQPAPLVHPVQLAVLATRPPKDPTVPLVPLAVPAWMPNTARAHVVPRKLKELQNRINPNTILGQYRFDYNDQFFQFNLKLIVTIMLFICNRI